MSNYRAIATVTAVLQHNLERAFEDVDTGSSGPAATAMTVRPDNIKDDFVGVNIFLYQASPNAALRNLDVPTRSPDGRLVNRPQAALDLNYLLSFYGKETDLTPQILMGRTVSFLHGQPQLSREDISALAPNTGNGNPRPSIVAQSQLEDQVELVKFCPIGLDLEELSKLWSIFFQTPYVLSTAYQASVVLIESDGAPESALPVQSRKIFTLPFQAPVIERITMTSGGLFPFLPGETMVIQGRRLEGAVTKVRVGEQLVTPAALSDSEIRLAVPAGLAAGVHGVQVVHEIPMGTPPALHHGPESNLSPIVLCPQIQKDQEGKYILAYVPNTGTVHGNINDQNDTGRVTLTIDPLVVPGQRVLLVLNELAADQPRNYSFQAPAIADATGDLQFPVQALAQGTYLVRVRVDGTTSPLDSNEQGRFVGPTLKITKTDDIDG